MNWVQCKLSRPTESGQEVHVAWLPSQYATVGQLVKIDSMGDGYWRVDSTYEKKDGEYLDPKSRDHLKQRKASDV